MSYAPTPGSVADRAVKALGYRAAPITTGQLADAVNCDSSSLSISLKAAVDHGLIVRDRRSPRVSFWSLGNGTPPEPRLERNPQPDDDPPIHRLVPASEAPPLARSMDFGTSMLLPWKPAASQVAEPEDPVTPPKGAQAAQAPVKPSGRASTTPKDGAGPQGFRCALWSNGILEIHRETVGGAADFILLAADEVRHLVRYLERMAESGA